MVQLYLLGLALSSILATEPALALNSDIQQQTGYVSRTVDQRSPAEEHFTPGARRDRSLRERREMGHPSVSFDLVTNTLNCSTGLTHAGVYIQFEYSSRSGESPYSNWVSLINVTLDPTTADVACQMITKSNLGLDVMGIGNGMVQFRVVQPDHGGGDCNCWGVHNFTVSTSSGNQNIPVNFDGACDNSALKNGQNSCLGTTYFCGGSAIRPRGVVTTTIDLGNGTNVDNIENVCNESRSKVVEMKGPDSFIRRDCQEHQPRIELRFTLNLRINPSTCPPSRLFDEGVIVAIGNWNNSGQWIPLKYYTNSMVSMRAPSRFDINIGNLKSGNISSLRGYPVPFIENITVVEESIEICNDDILTRDGIQFRWLQTASIKIENNSHKDTWSLDNVSVILHLNETHSKVLLRDDFGHQNVINSSLWNVDIRNGLLGNVCGEQINTTLSFGTSCTTVRCEVDGSQITVSRLVTTAPQNISDFFTNHNNNDLISAIVSSSSDFFELTSTPVSTELTSTPVSTELTPTPVSTQLTSTPVFTELTPTPVSTQLTSTPVSTELTSTPVSTELTPTPVSTELTSTPVSTELTSTPVSTQLTSTPVSTQLTSTPVSTQPAPTPVSTELTSTPVSSQLTLTSIISSSHIAQVNVISSSSTQLVSDLQKSKHLITSLTYSLRSQSISKSVVTNLETTQTPTPTPNMNDLFEDQVQKDLMERVERTQSLVNGTKVYMEILFMLPIIDAIQSLSKLVNDQESIDETVVAYLLSDILDGTENLTNRSRDEEMEFAQSFISITNQLILRTINKIPERSTIAGSTLLSALDQFIFTTFSGQLASGGNVELVVSRVFYNEGDRDKSLFTTIDSRDNSLEIPSELLRHLSEIFKKEGPFTTVSYLYSNLSGLLPGSLPGRNDTQLASSVVSTSIQQGGILYDTSGIHLRTPVIITLSHNQLVQDMMVKDSEAKVYCVFWEFILQSSGSDSGGLVSGRWNTDGCRKNDKLSDITRTVCECTHLTNFAILLSARPIQDLTQALVLGIIGYIGVTLSVAAMIVTIFILIFLRSLWSMRNFIHINLCISLTLAQLTFVIGVTPHGGGDLIDPGCRTAAVLIQFFFLVSFMWMLMEGVVLYIALVKVFTKYHRQYMIGFALASYGVPILYMVLCIPLGFAVNPEPDYGYIQQANDTSDTPRIVCWLNPYTNFFLTFFVPVVVIILLNIGFFIMAISIMYKHSKKQMHKSVVQNAKYWLRSSISLLAIMGLTWLVGVLVFDVQGFHLIPFAYIFTICVAFQGLAIFVIFVPLSKQVREAYSKWWRVKVAESDFLSKHFGDMSFTSKNSTAMTGVSTQTKSRNTLDNQPNVLTIESSIAPNQSFMETAQKSNNEEDTLTRLGTSFDVYYIIRAHDYQKEDLSEESGDGSMAGHHHQPNSSNMLNRTPDSRDSYKNDLMETTEEENYKKDTLSLSTKDCSQRLTTLGFGNRDAVGLPDEAIEMKDDPLHESLASDRTQDSCLDCHCNAHMQDQLLTTAVDGAIFINQAVLGQDSECVTISKL